MQKVRVHRDICRVSAPALDSEQPVDLSEFMIVEVSSVVINGSGLVQSSAVTMWSNVVRYFINNYRNWGRISIRRWIYKRHTIPCHNRWAMGCFLWIYVHVFIRKKTHYNGTAWLYVQFPIFRTQLESFWFWWMLEINKKWNNNFWNLEMICIGLIQISELKLRQKQHSTPDVLEKISTAY